MAHGKLLNSCCYQIADKFCKWRYIVKLFNSNNKVIVTLVRVINFIVNYLNQPERYKIYEQK